MKNHKPYSQKDNTIGGEKGGQREINVNVNVTHTK